MSGRVNPLAGATIDFRLYGPNDATCSGAPVFTSTVQLPGRPAARSRRRRSRRRRPGTYRWRAFYSGDANNAPVSGACNDANETRVVAPARPDDHDQRLGQHRARRRHAARQRDGDRARQPGRRGDGRVPPLRPERRDVQRHAGVHVDRRATRSAGGSVPSAAFTPTQAGTYRWRAFYSGDANNPPVSGRLQRRQRDDGRRTRDADDHDERLGEHRGRRRNADGHARPSAAASTRSRGRRSTSACSDNNDCAGDAGVPVAERRLPGGRRAGHLGAVHADAAGHLLLGRQLQR